MATSKIVMNILHGFFNPIKDWTIQNDSDFFDLINRRTSMKWVLVKDDSKTMKILNAANTTYLWMVIAESNGVWAKHPDFIAFGNDRVFYGKLELSDNDYNVSSIYRCSAS